MIRSPECRIETDCAAGRRPGAVLPAVVAVLIGASAASAQVRANATDDAGARRVESSVVLANPRRPVRIDGGPTAGAMQDDRTDRSSGARSFDEAKSGFLSLNRVDAALELSAEYEQRRVRIGDRFLFDGTRQRNIRQTFDEQLTLDFDLSIYDADLLSLAGSIAFGLTQERFRETFANDAETDTDDGFLAEFDLRADFLRGKKLSGSAYGTKARDRFSRPFLPSLREERNDYGFALYWADDRLPMELTFDHRNVDRTGGRRSFDDENLSEDLLRYQAQWISSPSHSLRFVYEYAENRERFSGSSFTFDNVRNEIRLEDELLFGKQRQHRLDTIVRFQDESGDYARDLFEIGPRLSLRHGENLTTHYQYQFSREQIGDLRFDIHRGDWQLVHQLYTNLTTTVNVFGMNERVEDDTETWDFGASVDWSYTRKNRHGRFSANLAVSAESSRTRGGGTRAMVGESGTLRDPLPIILSRTGILPWTIVVRSPSGLRVFVPGIDYFIQQVGSHTLIVRNILGTIPIGASVRIDYLYNVDADGGRDSQRVDFRVQQDFDNGLTPYYALSFRHDDRDARNTIFRSGDFESNRHRIGVRYRKDRFGAGAEFELLQDTIDPFTAYRLYASSAVLKRPGGTIDVRADLSQYFFDKSDRDETLILELSADGRAALNRNGEAFLTTTYRFEDDGGPGRGTIHGVDLEGGLTYRWGLLTISASVEYDLLTIADTKEDGMGVFIRIRRDFPNILGGGR